MVQYLYFSLIPQVKHIVLVEFQLIKDEVVIKILCLLGLKYAFSF